MLDQAAEKLVAAEACIDLLRRLSPEDASAEKARVERAFARGEKLVVGLKKQPPIDLSSTRQALERVREICAPLGPLGLLSGERAAELELEARLVEALGTARFRELASERFPVPAAALGSECDGFVAEASTLEVPVPPSVHRSDDEADPKSLVVRLRVRARELGLKVRIRVSREQLATAATGDGLVMVRQGVLLSAAAGERIAVHELFAHALPRARAHFAEFALLRAGTRRSSDDEEGRAILVERRAGLLDAERRRELSWRHQAALGVRRGADPRETVTLLLGVGAPHERAVDLTLRVHRGGGLARELVYLPSYFALSRAFTAEPALERWFERGRVGLDAARVLSRIPPAPAYDRKASGGAAGPRRSPPA